MKCCIIMHNMIVDDERKSGIENWRPERSGQEPIREQRAGHNYLLNLVTQRQAIMDKHGNARLYADLVQHVWDWDGDQPVHPNAPTSPIFDPDSDEE